MILGSVIPEQNVYNGIYNSIRLKLVELGFIPDRSLYNNIADYKAAIEQLRHPSPGQTRTILEVRNVNSGISRQEMETNVFYINNIGRDNGDYAGGKATIVDYQNENDEKRYKRLFMPSKPQDLSIEISYKSESIKTDQLMRSILLMVLGERSYITSYSDDGTAGDSFLLMFNGEITMDIGNRLDKRARYTAKDLILIEPIVLKDNIMPAATIEPQIGDTEVVSEFPNEA